MSSKDTKDTKTIDPVAAAMFQSMSAKFLANANANSRVSANQNPNSRASANIKHMEQVINDNPILESQLLPIFTKALTLLLESLGMTFPECIMTQIFLMKLKEHHEPTGDVSMEEKSLAFQASLMFEWHSLLRPYYEEILNGRYTRMFKELKNQELFCNLKLYDKFYDVELDDSDRQNLIKMINKLNAVCCFYNTIPGSLLILFESIGKNISAKIKDSLGEPEIHSKMSKEEKDATMEAYNDEIKKMTASMIPSEAPMIMSQINEVMSQLKERDIESFRQNVALILQFLEKVPSLKHALNSCGFIDMFGQMQNINKVM